jgi:P-type Mg2+ transporter
LAAHEAAREGTTVNDVVSERSETSEPHRDGAMPANGEIEPEEIWTEPIDRILTRPTTPGPYDRGGAVAIDEVWTQYRRHRQAFAALAAIPVSLPQPAGHHPARGGLLVVVTIVTTSISLGFVPEVRAQNAVEALRRSVAVQASVLLACL